MHLRAAVGIFLNQHQFADAGRHEAYLFIFCRRPYERSRRPLISRPECGQDHTQDQMFFLFVF